MDPMGYVHMYVYVHCWINIQYHLSTDFPGDHGLKSSGALFGIIASWSMSPAVVVLRVQLVPHIKIHP